MNNSSEIAQPHSGGFQSPRTAATLLAAMAGGLTYTACIFLKLPTPRYFPVSGVWDFGAHAGSISMGYYGNLLLAALTLFLTYGLARLPTVGRRLSAPLPARILSAAAPIIIGLCLLAQAAHELHRWGGR